MQIRRADGDPDADGVTTFVPVRVLSEKNATMLQNSIGEKAMSRIIWTTLLAVFLTSFY
jgi:hypothetical protein